MKKVSTETPSNFRKIIERIAWHHDAYKVFSSFCTMAACAVAAETREEEYLEEVKRWNREEVSLFVEAFAALIDEMDKHPFTDLLGTFYMDFALSDKSKQWRGEFHTPQHICELMAKLISCDIPPEGPITLLEPASGSGAMILAHAHNLKPADLGRLRVTAIDLSKTACDMCYINTTLWNIPAQIVHGNTLSHEYFAQWKNVPWMMHGCLDLFYPNSTPPSDIPPITPHSPVLTNEMTEIIETQGKPPTAELTGEIKAQCEQQFFDFS